MKSRLNKTVVFLLAMVLLGSISIPACAKNDQGYITVNGVVRDKQTRKRLEYVNISIPGTSIGTITNSDGIFEIKVADSIRANKLEISSLGYFNEYIPLKGEDIENAVIFLTPSINTLPEVVIMGMNPLDLIKAAVSKIAVNNSQNPNMLTGFYRETVKKRRNYINVTEAIVNVYKSPYTENMSKDRVEVYKGRQLVSPKRGDTLIVKLQGGPNVSIFLDIVKNRELLFDEQAFRDYKFMMNGSVMLDERPHYVVSFEPQLVQPYPLFYGKVYIDKENLAFTQAEFSHSMKDRNKIIHTILKKKPFNLRFKPEELTYLVTYRYENGRSYLNYLRNEIKFKCDWKRKLFSTNYEVLSEMVVTDKQLQNVTPIPYKQAFSLTNILSDKVHSFYDEDFWEGYNIIAPTESLESAVNRLRKKHIQD